MANPMLPVVLAQALTTGIRLRNEKVTELVEVEGGEIEERVVTHQIDAVPGEVIDVTGWSHIQAYVERGQILLLTQTQTTEVLESLVPVKEAADAAAAEKATTGSKRTNQKAAA